VYLVKYHGMKAYEGVEV